jgi:hypothetical protein
MTLFKGPCCWPCASCFDLSDHCLQFTIGGVQGPASGPPYCNANGRYSSCPDYNGTWTLIPQGPFVQGSDCLFYVCRAPVCCFNDFGPPFNPANGPGTGWLYTLSGGSGGWSLNWDCTTYGDARYTKKGPLINGPNIFTLTGKPIYCLGWPQTIQLTPIPPQYDASGKLIPCDTCCACPDPWPAYTFTIPAPPGDCDSGSNPQPQPNAACTCGAIFGQTFEMRLQGKDSPWACQYGVTVDEWSFNLIIQNLGPDERTVSLTGSLSSQCIYPGIISAGQLLRWQQTYVTLGLATQPCATNYSLPIAPFGDDLGCYCFESFFGEGPTIEVAAVTS